jgi:uncharacterized membrane protein YdbT with pleckstrin-like domain
VLYAVVQSAFGGVSLIDNTIHPIILFFGTILLEATILIYIFLQWAYDKFEVKDTKIIFKKGIIRREKAVHSLKNIESIEVKQGWLGLIFDYGDVSLFSPLLKEKIVMKKISDPEKYAHILRKVLDMKSNKFIPVKH